MKWLSQTRGRSSKSLMDTVAALVNFSKVDIATVGKEIRLKVCRDKKTSV